MPPRLTAFVLALYAGYAAAEASPPAVVINHGHLAAAAKGPDFRSFPRGTLPQAGPWLGLYCGKAGCEIREATVAVMGGTLADCDDGDAYAETIFATGNPVAVFNGLRIPLGKVPTTLLAKKEANESGHFRQLRKLGQWQVKLRGKPLGISWVRLPRPRAPDETMYRYHFNDGAAKQFFFSSFGPVDGDKGGTVAPFVHWAGDLDDDGRLDLLVEIPYGMTDGDERCDVAYRLYLSTLAAEGEILHKAAQTTGRQPACICRAAPPDG